MAIVGTAFVRLRVIGDKLANDISKATKDAVKDAAPDLKESGGEAGDSVGEGLGEHVEASSRQQMDRIGDEIGDVLGRAMGQALGRSLRRRMGDSFRSGFAGIESKIAPIKAKVTPIFDKVGEDWGKATSGKFTGIFRKAILPGIALIATALPSALAFAGAAVGALAATAITAMAAVGPAIAGAGVAGVAAFGAIKISAGLIGLALKQQTPALEDYQERLNNFKTTIATPIQAGLLSGLNASMRLLGPVVTTLQPQLVGLGIAAGNVAIGFADAIRQGVMMDRIGRILETNNQFVRDAGGGVSALGQAFIIVLDAMRPVTSMIGEMIGYFGDWVLRTTEAGDASGALGTSITSLFDSFRYFVGIIFDFAAGMGNVFKAAFGASGGMITNLHDTANAFREWTGDPANQERMTRFFERMRIIAGQVLTVIRDISGAALRGLEGTSVERFTGALDTLRSLGAPIADMFRQIQDAAGPQLQVAFQNFAQMIIDLADSGVIGMVATALGNLFAVISMILQIPGIGTLLAFLGGLAAILKTVQLLWVVLGPLWNIFMILVNVVGLLASAFGVIPLVIAAIIGGLIYFFAFTETGRAMVAAAIDGIVAAFFWCRDAVVAAFHWVVDQLGVAWTWITTQLSALAAWFSSIWGQITAGVSTAVGAVRDVIVSVWTAIWGFIQPILQGIWNVISTIFNAIVSVVTTYLNILWEIWSRIFTALLLPVRIFYGLAILLFQLLMTGIEAILGFLWGIVTAIWNAIFSFMSGVIGGLVDVVVAGWNVLYNFVSGILSGLWSVVTAAWNAISGAISAAMSAVWNVVSSGWNAVTNFIGGILDWIGGRIRSVWNTFSGLISGALDTVMGVVRTGWNAVVDFVQGALDRIGGIVSGIWGGLENLGGGIVSGLKTALNGVIGAVNTVIGGINSAIDLANKLPGPDIPTIDKIPRLARGGTVRPTSDGTLAVIAEAGRPERVEPLDADGLSTRDRAMINLLAGSGGNSGGVAVYIGTRELTELVDFVVEDREDRLADRVLTGRKG